MKDYQARKSLNDLWNETTRLINTLVEKKILNNDEKLYIEGFQEKKK